jgi:hypothetical protein
MRRPLRDSRLGVLRPRAAPHLRGLPLGQRPTARSLDAGEPGRLVVRRWRRRLRPGRMAPPPGTDVAGICLFDTSSEMLANSARWVARGATADVACAEALPIADGGADLVVASLADPYDTASWWQEVSCILAPSGRLMLTAVKLSAERSFLALSHPSSNDSASKLSELRAAVNHAAGDPRFPRSGRVKLTTALATSSGRVRGARAALVAVEPAFWRGLRVLAQRFSAIVFAGGSCR